MEKIRQYSKKIEKEKNIRMALKIVIKPETLANLI